MGTSPVTAITGIFGATQEARASKEAMRILNEARMQGLARSQELDRRFDPFVGLSQDYLTQAGESVRMMQDVVRQAQGLEVSDGLSAADEIAYKDAARLLNEQMVSTGNLRSGAAAFGQAELLRRVVADASQRSFNRRLQKMNLLLGGTQAAANEYGQLGSVSGQIGLTGRSLSAQLLMNAMGISTNMANAEIRKGAALANQITAYGVVADEMKDTGREAWGDFLGGVSAFYGKGGSLGNAGSRSIGGGSSSAGLSSSYSADDAATIGSLSSMFA